MKPITTGYIRMKLILAFPFLFISAGATAVPSLSSFDLPVMTVRDRCFQMIRDDAERDALAGGYRIVRMVAAKGREEATGVYHCTARFECWGGPAGLSLGPWYELYRLVEGD